MWETEKTLFLYKLKLHRIGNNIFVFLTMNG